MRKTNWKRVFWGGMLAGIVLNILYFIILVVSYERYEFTTSSIAYFYITGIMAVWLYSAIRPRYGREYKTAVIAGFAVGLLCGLTHFTFGGWVSRRIVLAILLMYIVATLAGTWIYKKQP